MSMAKKQTNLSPAMLKRVAEQFRALSEASRLRLMNLLFEGEASVGELVERSGFSLANTSKQLNLLYQAGWLTRRKEGLTVLYTLADDRVRSLCDLMCNRVRELANQEASLLAPPQRRKQL